MTMLHVLAPREYVRPKEWKVFRHYATGVHAQFDPEDISFDMYSHAKHFMELRGIKMLPENKSKWITCIFGLLFGRPASPPTDMPFANSDALCATRAVAGLDCALWRVLEFCNLNGAGCMTKTAM